MTKDQEIQKLKDLLKEAIEWNWIDWEEEKADFGDDAPRLSPSLYNLEIKILEALE